MPHLSLRTDDDVDYILNKYADTVYKIAYSQTKDKYHAEDVFQEVFLRLIKKKPVFDSENHLKAWLIRVTINCSKSIFLSSYFKKRTVLHEDIIDTKNTITQKSELYEAVLALPKKYSRVIYLHYYEGYSVKEIAELLTIKEATVKTHLLRGRKQLKRVLGGRTNLE
ncbi:sigma-70 family RNA polymerase sigma factor [Vallitalea pronyensis]|uniref:Sigma-70 family RNA polymerase sigma factor n=1 Tax=Vallitalea pronyensis TaxID=1348613 RepID=A0A8J8MMQ7_9FIRM|nr:sigma-70 family RNA polymerase sigma factor [Vallitalea pronyensis]QUI24098.1 sigma-70 family RNA polymerase sigma factor [Vallitalea pronyensis]